MITEVGEYGTEGVDQARSIAHGNQETRLRGDQFTGAAIIDHHGYDAERHRFEDNRPAELADTREPEDICGRESFVQSLMRDKAVQADVICHAGGFHLLNGEWVLHNAKHVGVTARIAAKIAGIDVPQR